MSKTNVGDIVVRATMFGDIVVRATMFGIAGWVAENTLCREDRYSALFRGHRVPFLPVYAVGGVAMTSATPHLAKWPPLARALSYAVIGTAVEYAGCKIDRDVLGARSWDYGARDSLARSSEGCLNFAHAALWGGLGLVAEKFTS